PWCGGGRRRVPGRAARDLTRPARASPAASASAWAGPGTPHHLFSELFKRTAGIELTHVPYRGSVPALSDVAAGHVQMMFCDIPPALSLIAEGKVRALGVSTRERVAPLPQLAPIAELGVPGFDA